MDWHCQIQQVWTVRRGLVGPHDRGYCRRLSDPRERPGPLKESLVTCSSLERVCHATPHGGSGRSSPEAEGGGCSWLRQSLPWGSHWKGTQRGVQCRTG